MISERQAIALLDDCEAYLGRRLDGLRAMLGKSDDTLGALWELVVLHKVIQLGAGIDHEPSEGQPDVAVGVAEVPRFWIEATHLRSAQREAAGQIDAFIRWMRRDLRERHQVDPGAVEIRVEGLSPRSDPDVGSEHLWASLRSSSEWKELVGSLRQGNPGRFECVLPAPFQARIEVKLQSKPQEYLSSSYPMPRVVDRINEHPIWSALRTKGKQASAWKLGGPLVVCIGSSLDGTILKTAGFGPGAEAALSGALSDTSKWHPMHQHNYLRDTSGKRYQVHGAKRISAVVLVSIEDPVQLHWLRRDNNRVAKTRLVVNPDAMYPLLPSQVQLLQGVDWNSFPYGPQWETWPAPQGRARKDPRRIASRSEPGKVVSMRPKQDGSFELLLPAEDLTKVLGGVEGIEKLLESVRGVHASAHLARLPPLVAAEVVPGDPKLRKASMLKLTFASPLDPLVQVLRGKE
jgi:hypothetical protein